MVSTSSAAAQATENEKRRKQTMEKVKANHLSRQLQMRLQYARLKVEHGWQKQNLNEVENLYFHNSHLRGSKPFPVPTIITTQQQHSSFPGPQPATSQSSLSFKLVLGRNAMNTNVVNDQNTNFASQEDVASNQAIQTMPIPDHASPNPDTDPSSRFNLLEDTSAMVVEPQERISSGMGSTKNSVLVVLNGSSDDVDMAPGEPSVPTNSLSPPQDSQSPIDPLLSSTNHYPSVKPPRPRAQKAPSGSKALPSLTAKDMYNFGSTSTLTYDSFWSSHSGSTTPRPTKSSGIAEFVPTFQIPGDFTSGIQDLGRPTTNSTFTSLSTLQPQQ